MLPEISCIIMDDEPKAIALLRERLKILFPNLKIKATFTEWQKGYEALRSTDVDILFLDVSMPEKTGIDFLKLFPAQTFQVIFITAHSEFALQAIKFSAVGYVLKPIDDYELSFAVNKAISKIDGIAEVRGSKNIPNETNPLKIGIPNIKGIEYINVDEILYFESVNGYTKIVTADYSIVSSYNIGEFKKLITANYFFQTHRSYIVNMHHIKKFEMSGFLVMADNMEIPVSRNAKAEFQNAFNQLTKVAGPKK